MSDLDLTPYDITANNFNSKRDRLVELYKIIKGKPYPIIVAKKYMLSIEELVEREIVDYGTDFKEDDYDYSNIVQLTIPKIAPILPNLENYSVMGIKKPSKNIVEIYDVIQEYIYLWCVIKRDYPYYQSATEEELRGLESVALWAFVNYNYYNNYNNRAKQKNIINSLNPSEMGALDYLNLMTLSKKEQEQSFVSHLDNYLNQLNRVDITPVTIPVLTSLGDWSNGTIVHH